MIKQGDGGFPKNGLCKLLGSNDKKEEVMLQQLLKINHAQGGWSTDFFAGLRRAFPNKVPQKFSTSRQVGPTTRKV